MIRCIDLLAIGVALIGSLTPSSFGQIFQRRVAVLAQSQPTQVGAPLDRDPGRQEPDASVVGGLSGSDPDSRDGAGSALGGEAHGRSRRESICVQAPGPTRVGRWAVVREGGCRDDTAERHVRSVEMLFLQRPIATDRGDPLRSDRASHSFQARAWILTEGVAK